MSKVKKGPTWIHWKVIGRSDDTHPTVQCKYCSKTYNRAVPKRMQAHLNECLNAVSQHEQQTKIDNSSGHTSERELFSFAENLQWYQKEAEFGNNFAQYCLGIFYENVEKDEDKAFKWYKKSAEKDYCKAQYKLGLFLKNGIGTTKDLKKSFYWCERAAKNGDKDAQFNLAEYCKDSGENGDKEDIFVHEKANLTRMSLINDSYIIIHTTKVRPKNKIDKIISRHDYLDVSSEYSEKEMDEKKVKRVKMATKGRDNLSLDPYISELLNGTCIS